MDCGGAETLSIAYRVFTFEESKQNTQESLSVSIPEVSLSFLTGSIIILQVQQVFMFMDTCVKLTSIHELAVVFVPCCAVKST